MSFLTIFRKLDRQHWFICYKCLGDSNHDEIKSVFHSVAPKVLVVGRPWQQCPRCGSTNTKSFSELKDEGQESALWGLERIVKRSPRQLFEVEGSGTIESARPDAASPNRSHAR